MKHLVYTLCALLLLALASTFLVTGCNDDDDNAPSTVTLTVSPSSVSFTAGIVTNVQFTAVGGRSPFTWSVSDASLGAIVSSGSTAIYTSTTNSGRNYINLSDSATNSATATVNQNP